jgi:hypothetical protein
LEEERPERDRELGCSEGTERWQAQLWGEAQARPIKGPTVGDCSAAEAVHEVKKKK